MSLVNQGFLVRLDRKEDQVFLGSEALKAFLVIKDSKDRRGKLEC